MKQYLERSRVIQLLMLAALLVAGFFGPRTNEALIALPIAIVLLLGLSLILHRMGRIFPRIMALAASLAWLITFLLEHQSEPGLGFLVMLLWVGFAFSIFPSERLMKSDATRRGKVHSGSYQEGSFMVGLLAQPAAVLVLSFLAIGGLGALVLSLPPMSSDAPHTWIDSLFTAVSATCVTGLVTLDTPVAFTFAGQAAILLLIQLGGLGIMVFSAAAFVLFGRRLSLTHERAAVDLIGASGRADLIRATRLVFLVTFLTEGVGALLLFGAFWASGDPWKEALWRGVFTSISAFCNAGFALQSDSLIPYADNPIVLLITSAVIIIGGLGPGVIAALVTWRNRHQRTVHNRLVLWTTGLLLFGPMLSFLILEWGNTLGNLSIFDRIVNAWFQSVTLRTAGFNSVDLAAVHPATLILLMLIMFVGGSPGSTAGGIKTTTAAIIFLSVVAVIRGRNRIEVFGRTIPNEIILKSTAIALLGVMSVVLALAAILLTQTMSWETATFEVISALATVGLSIGGTGELDEIGKVIIIACMFAGRVGPLTLLIFMVSRTPSHTRKGLPIERPVVG